MKLFLQKKKKFDQFISFLCGKQVSQMEISYTKQQQKQKQTQMNKNQDSDAMGVFEKHNQLLLQFETQEYFQESAMPEDDKAKADNKQGDGEGVGEKVH